MNSRNVLFMFMGWAVLVLAGAFCSDVRGRVITVNAEGTGEYATIQAAIDVCGDGDTVVLAEGTYTGVGNRDIDVPGKDITVRSVDPEDPDVVAATVIDCEGAGRGLTIGGNATVSPTIKGLTITNGYANRGGGIYCSGSRALIANCSIVDNLAEGRLSASGGGILCSGGAPTILNCSITHNWVIAKTWGEASGIYCESSSPTIIDSTIADNWGECPGAIEGNNSNMTLIGCCIKSNGGGVHAYDRSHLRVENSVILDNSGIITSYVHSFSRLTMRNCVIAGNSTTTNACPGVQLGWESTFVVVNCTIVGNTSPSGEASAGGICYDGNSASGSVLNSIIRDNWGDEISPWNSNPVVSISVDYCDIEGGYQGEGNIDVDPVFADAAGGDYHLLPNSQCIDAGDADYEGKPDETDLDGNARVIGGRIDMGAYESNCVEAAMRFTPRALNIASQGRPAKARLVLPEGFDVSDVDVDVSARLWPLCIESDYIDAYVNRDGLVEIEIGFDRAVACSTSVGSGPVEVMVMGRLTTGQTFYGLYTIRITGNGRTLLGTLASHWLETGCGAPDWCGGRDLNRDSVVNFADFAMFDEAAAGSLRGD